MELFQINDNFEFEVSFSEGFYSCSVEQGLLVQVGYSKRSRVGNGRGVGKGRVGDVRCLEVNSGLMGVRSRGDVSVQQTS